MIRVLNYLQWEEFRIEILDMFKLETGWLKWYPCFDEHQFINTTAYYFYNK